MANSDSRHTTPTLRWGETTGEVVDANVVEPSGGKKSTGWVPGVDGAVAEWFNWLWYAAGAMLRYIEASRAKMWTRNHLMRGAGAGEGAVTNGVGLSLNVASAAVWVDGAMYQVPAATNLALAAADPTDDRIDLVIARVTAGTPEFAVVTGTPDPAPEAPALPAGAVAIAEVEVDAADTIPGSATDRRLFGAISMDLLRADKQLAAGDMGAQFFFLVEDLGAAWSYKVGGSNNPILEISDFGRSVFFDADVITLPPEVVTFEAPITRKFDIHASAFMPRQRDFSGGVDVDIVYLGLNDSYQLQMFGAALSPDDSGAAVAPVQIPNGATITAVRAYGNKPGTGSLNVLLFRANKISGAISPIGGDSIASGAATGDFILQNDALSHVVDQEYVYYFRALFEDTSAQADSCILWAAEVEYTEAVPWGSL